MMDFCEYISESLGCMKTRNFFANEYKLLRENSVPWNELGKSISGLHYII
jgi:hypothetical protein